MDETLFYVVGGALVVLALVFSFAGMRDEDFPSPRVFRGMVGVFAVLVVLTAVGAVLLARAEQEHRREELNHEAALEAEAEELAAEESETQEVEGEAAGGGGETPGDEADAPALFIEAGCADCHALAAAGAEGVIGPNLDLALADQDIGFIEKSIIDPGAEIAEGFSDGIMPNTYGQELTRVEIEQLALYIEESVHSE